MKIQRSTLALCRFIALHAILVWFLAPQLFGAGFAGAISLTADNSTDQQTQQLTENNIYDSLTQNSEITNSQSKSGLEFAYNYHKSHRGHHRRRHRRHDASGNEMRKFLATTEKAKQTSSIQSITPTKKTAVSDPSLQQFDNSILSPSEREVAEAKLASEHELANFRSKNCTACMQREQAKVSRIAQIKRDILAKLGLASTPNVTARAAASIPLHNSPLSSIMRRYNLPIPSPSGARTRGGGADGMQGDQPRQDYQEPYDVNPTYKAKTERIYLFANPASESWALPDNNQIALFTFSEATLQQEVDRAHLHVFVRHPNSFGDNAIESNSINRHKHVKCRLDVFMITSVADPSNVKRDLIRTKELRFSTGSRHSEGRWESLSVAKIVTNWLSRPHENSGLLAQVFCDSLQTDNLVVYPGAESEGSHNMYLDLATRDGVKNRFKRDLASADLDCQNDPEERCCRRKLIIDFQEFGWDFIVAPKQYMAYYCSGGCPYSYLQQFPHTHVAQTAGIGPCCTPADMEEIVMVYFNSDHELMVSKVPGMIVTRCGCA